MTCKVDGCERSIKNKTNQLCNPHYKRYWRYGDVQAHIPVPESRRAPLEVIDHEDGTRTCAECNERKQLEDFHRDKRAPLGRRPSCKTCRTAVETARYNADPEAHRERMRQFRRDNLEHVRQREANAYLKHREARIESAIEHSHIRRARIQQNGYERGVTVPALRKKHGDHCHYCGVLMTFGRSSKGTRPANLATLEHLTPIARGGSHTWGNTALSCWACNISKSSRDYPNRLMLIG